MCLKYGRFLRAPLNIIIVLLLKSLENYSKQIWSDLQMAQRNEDLNAVLSTKDLWPAEVCSEGKGHMAQVVKQADINASFTSWPVIEVRAVTVMIALSWIHNVFKHHFLTFLIPLSCNIKYIDLYNSIQLILSLFQSI